MMKMLELIQESGAEGITAIKRDPLINYKGKAAPREKTRYAVGSTDLNEARTLAIMYSKHQGDSIELYEGKSNSISQHKC